MLSPEEKAAFTTLTSRWGACPLCGERRIAVGETLIALPACRVSGEGELAVDTSAAVPVVSITCKSCLFMFFVPYKGLQELAKRGPVLRPFGRPKLFGE